MIVPVADVRSRAGVETAAEVAHSLPQRVQSPQPNRQTRERTGGRLASHRTGSKAIKENDLVISLGTLVT
jgi:hypothetical protein